jgi:cephalosporin hydroxylase
MNSLSKNVVASLQATYRGFYSHPIVSRMIINQFTRLYYQTPIPVRTWHDTRWLGVPAMKTPLDLWNYQEIIAALRPDILIETGTAKGGSALFFASLFDLLGSGRVVTIDIEPDSERPRHDRITYLLGSSTAPETVARVEQEISNCRNVMVVLDSGHSMQNVLNELQTYSRYVSQGSYLIVEDTCVNGHPVSPQYGPGPMEAVEAFLGMTDSFVRDGRDRKFLMTFNPGGYLRKVK